MRVLDRRQWIKLCLAAGTRAGLGAGSLLLPACDSSESPRIISLAAFETSATGAIIWGAADCAARATIELVDGASSEAESAGELEFSAERGLTGFAELDGLEPDRAYRYRLNLKGAVSEWHQLRTAPQVDADADLSFVISADLDNDPLFVSPIVSHLIGEDAHFFICLGDWPYADNPPGAFTASEFREKHRQARAFGDYPALLERYPVYAIYDDHELRNDWDAVFRETEADRIAAGLEVWDEWFPLRPGPTPEARYRSWRWGRHAEFFMLDARRFRSANADPDGPEKTMLGSEQLSWLMNELAASTATFKLILSPVPLDFGFGLDHWAGFASERTAIVEFIASSNIEDVLFISGDQHWFAAYEHSFGLREFQVGPLARGIPELPPEPPEALARAAIYNYGHVRIRGGQTPSLEFSARGPDHELLYSETILAVP